MKEKLIELVCERAGISEDAATKAVDTIFGYLKDNPEKLQELVAGMSSSDALSRLPKLFGR